MTDTSHATPAAGDRATQFHRALIQWLEGLQQAGIADLPAKRRSPAAMQKTSLPAGNPSAPVPTAPSAVPPTPKDRPRPAPSAALRLDGPQPLAPALAERTCQLDVIRAQVAACTRCSTLCAKRTQTVFGVGDPAARLVFLGEAPGADEDRQGEPFVGRAGQLLNKIIEACTLTREQVYILNTIKCRPPDNRNPLDEELENCRPFLEAQLQVIRPEFICCLGAIASRALLGTTAPIGRLRGKLHDYGGVRVLCTYHPAYLLRNPAAKKDVWQDMLLLMDAMGLKLA